MEWLTATHGIPSTRIGITGASMGGATVLVAAALDPRFKAVWVDSPACDVLQVTNILYFINDALPTVLLVLSSNA